MVIFSVMYNLFLKQICMSSEDLEYSARVIGTTFMLLERLIRLCLKEKESTFLEFKH